MEFPQLDRLFDESLERSGKAPLNTSAYGGSPLASDHFLLKKSWDYFRSRVRTIEEQWKKIFQAKDAQIDALKTELHQARERTAELDEENHLLRSLDHTIKRTRTEDYVGFARKKENLQMHWDAEREALQRKIDDFEFRMTRAKKDSEARLMAAQVREKILKEEISTLKNDISTQGERERDVQRRWSEEIQNHVDRIQSLESKVEILKNEVERRDLIIRQLKESASTQEKDAHAMIQYVAELQRALREKDTEMGHLKTRLDILRKEKETMRASWEREQAEWRELWDRARESQERRKL